MPIKNQLRIFISVQDIDLISHHLCTGITIIFNDWFTFLTALGSNDNNTIAASRTVNGRSRSILQDLDRFNIRRLNRSQRTDRNASGITHIVTQRHTVYHIQRRAARCNRTDTTHFDVKSRARSSVRLHNLHTCHTTHQSLFKAGSCHVLYIGSTYRRNRSSDISFTLCTISHNYHFVQQFRVFMQNHFAESSTVSFQFQRLITDIRKQQYTIFWDTG